MCSHFLGASNRKMWMLGWSSKYVTSYCWPHSASSLTAWHFRCQINDSKYNFVTSFIFFFWMLTNNYITQIADTSKHLPRPGLEFPYPVFCFWSSADSAFPFPKPDQGAIQACETRIWRSKAQKPTIILHTGPWLNTMYVMYQFCG